MFLLSIIIPHYNTPILLRKLLSTIPVQPEIQIIVIDDRSTEDLDLYAQVIADFPHVVFLENTTEGKGAGVARNLGLGQASGTWILFADADDYFLPDFYDIIKKYVQSSEDIIFFTATSLALDTQIISDRHLENNEKIRNHLKKMSETTENVLRYTYYEPWSKLIRHQLIQDHQIQFGTTMIGEDVMFSMKTSFHAKKITASPEIIYCITRSHGSLTTVKTPNMILERTEVFLQRNDFLKAQLSKKAFQDAHISPLNLILNCLVYRLGWDTFSKVWGQLREHQVKICTWRDWKDCFRKLKKKKITSYITTESRNP